MIIASAITFCFELTTLNKYRIRLLNDNSTMYFTTSVMFECGTNKLKENDI